MSDDEYDSNAEDNDDDEDNPNYSTSKKSRKGPAGDKQRALYMHFRILEKRYVARSGKVHTNRLCVCRHCEQANAPLKEMIKAKRDCMLHLKRCKWFRRHIAETNPDPDNDGSDVELDIENRVPSLVPFLDTKGPRKSGGRGASRSPRPRKKRKQVVEDEDRDEEDYYSADEDLEAQEEIKRLERQRRMKRMSMSTKKIRKADPVAIFQMNTIVDQMAYVTQQLRLVAPELKAVAELHPEVCQELQGVVNSMYPVVNQLFPVLNQVQSVVKSYQEVIKKEAEIEEAEAAAAAAAAAKKEELARTLVDAAEAHEKGRGKLENDDEDRHDNAEEETEKGEAGDQDDSGDEMNPRDMVNNALRNFYSPRGRQGA